MNWWRFGAGIVVVTALGVAMLAGCSAESAGGTGPPANETPRNPDPIDVVSVDGMAALSVPAGAAPAGYTFAISDITETAGLVSVGPVYSIEPSPTQFATPVTLSVTLPIDPEDIWVELRGADLSLARLTGVRWEVLETTYDPATRTLTAQITHLSSFGVSPDPRPPPLPGRRPPSLLALGGSVAGPCVDTEGCSRGFRSSAGSTPLRNHHQFLRRRAAGSTHKPHIRHVFGAHDRFTPRYRLLGG